MEPGPKKERREITYQVGWKKGKIEWHEGSSEAKTSSTTQGSAEQPDAANKLRLLWKAAPELPGAIVFPLLCALPAACFLLTLLLVYGLRLG